MQTENGSSKIHLGTQIIFIVVTGLLLAAIGGVGYVYAFESRHAETIYPGVSVAGVDLSGLTVEEAYQKLASVITYPEQGRILFIYGDSRWLYSPQQLGFSLDIARIAREAFAVGREGSLSENLSVQLIAAQQGINLAPVAQYDQRQAYAVLQSIASQVNLPVLEASISLNGTDVVIMPGQVGRQVDLDATLKVLDGLLYGQREGAVPLVVVEQQPLIMDATAAGEFAQQILSEALVLSLPEGNQSAGPWRIEPADLAKLIVIERQNDGNSAAYQVSVNQQAMSNYLSSLAPVVHSEPVNARFIFNDDTRQLDLLKPMVVGKDLNIPASLEAINTALQAGDHAVTLVLDVVYPQVKDDATAESLGITELVSAETSYFYGSDPGRVQNITLASQAYHGVLVAPGETFSMASYLTDISLENGYAEAPIIYGNETIQGVGGGVCQVSTTLFRTAFYGGFPIVERHAHAYRVDYYEQSANGSRNPNLAGLDATVYFPLVDLKFVNDTPYWLLMETYVSGYSLTWKFYSTSDGRTVEWNTTGIKNKIEPPEPLYRENPDLPTGTIEQVDWPVEGATVIVNRTVYKDGAVYFTDTFRTDYMPWGAIYEYGPGTEIPQ
jgi:vancomycin resistance protein YoaR